MRACVRACVRVCAGVLFVFYSTSLSLAGNSGRLTWVIKAQLPQEQRYPFLSVCAVFSCVQTMVWLPLGWGAGGGGGGGTARHRDGAIW